MRRRAGGCPRALLVVRDPLFGGMRRFGEMRESGATSGERGRGRGDVQEADRDADTGQEVDLRFSDPDAAISRSSVVTMTAPMRCAYDLLPALREPVEDLLAAGGDSRLLRDPATGLNRYGCATTPRDRAGALGSCTASSVSPVGYRAATRARRRLLAVGEGEALVEAVEERYEAIRADLLFVLTGGRMPGVEVVLSPSGTDIELFALALAHGAGRAAVCNVVVGPTEVGSGTPLAAAGCHFDVLAPSGETVVPGEPVDEDLAARTRVETVSLRDADGSTRSEVEIDDEVSALVADAIGRGSTVLLHVVAHSKTGVHAPSLGTVARLRAQHGDEVLVLVDAAQGRVSRRGLVEALQRGYLVLITGSKFYGGPPFSGALLVPEGAHLGRRGLDRLPPGFGEYFTAGQLPPQWVGLRRSLPPTGNPGLVLRWAAAVAEMGDYYATPSRLRLEVLRAFERLVPEILGSSPMIGLAPVSPGLFSNEVERLLESKMTVFPFSLAPPGEKAPAFDRAALGNVFRWLNADISRLLADVAPEDRRDLAPCIHVGQPVGLGHDGGGAAVLRVALGSVLLVKVSQDLECGDSLDERIHWLEDRLITLKRKLEVIATHYDTIAARSNGVERMSASA